MIEFYVVASLLSLSLVLNVYVVAYLLRYFSTENGKLQAAAFARRADPVTAAVYQTYLPGDERSVEMLLEDAPQNKDMKPLGL